MVFVETSFPRGGVSKPVKSSTSVDAPNIVSEIKRMLVELSSTK